MSMMVSFVLSFFPRDVLDEILNLIGSVFEGFPSYSYRSDKDTGPSDLFLNLHRLIKMERKFSGTDSIQSKISSKTSLGKKDSTKLTLNVPDKYK